MEVPHTTAGGVRDGMTRRTLHEPPTGPASRGGRPSAKILCTACQKRSRPIPDLYRPLPSPVPPPRLWKRIFGREMEGSVCYCEFHAREATGSLPAPILLPTPRPEDAFWLWLVRLEPKPIVAAVVDDGPRPHVRSFRSILLACKFVANLLKLPLSAEEVSALAGCALIRTKDGGTRPLSEVSLFCPSHPMVPANFGQSARCFYGKAATMEPARRCPKRKRTAAALPTSPSSPCVPLPSSSGEPSLAYDPATLGGDRKEVEALLVDHRIEGWNADVVKELLHQGARPPLVQCGPAHRDGAFPSVMCVFVQPDGTLVRNVKLPLGLVKFLYEKESEHLPL